MCRFAVFFVPELNSRFYQYGSSILGYDIRRNTTDIEIHPDLLGPLASISFNRTWVENASPYGFHLTIGDAINFSNVPIDIIEHELGEIWGSFSPKSQFILRRDKKEPVSIWREEIVVLRYKANCNLKMLQSLVVGRVNTLGNGSGYYDEYCLNPDQFDADEALRRRKFFAPFILDSYTPHFTLLNPYTGTEPDRVRRVFSRIFRRWNELEVSTICLMVQWDRNGPWRIHREFQR